MINLLVFAITETRGVTLAPLPCAVDDGRAVYSVLSAACGDEFDHALSGVVVNPSASQAREFLLHAAAAVHEQDLLIVYFSSHGVLHGGALAIPFGDASEDGFGHLESREIAAALRRSRAQILLVIDCCFSGAALAEANLQDVYDTPKISIIASALPYGRASYGDTGSDFTLAFVRAVQRTAGLGRTLTVNNIVQEITGDDVYAGDVLVNLAEGLSNLKLVSAPAWYRSIVERGDFERRFISRMSRSPAYTREMLWYSLDTMPDGLKLKILQLIQDQKTLREPGWLVRRAIGTVISRIDDVHPMKRQLILDMLRSRNWMQVCVGLVAGRHSVRDPEVGHSYREVLRQGRRMDATWLANLYLADQSDEDLSLALSSPLARTAWGVVDLWKRYEPVSDDPERLAGVFGKLMTGQPELLDALRLHLECIRHPAAGVLGPSSDPSLAENELVQFQYARRPRGVLSQAAVKWLISSLYGTWRDQLGGDLRDYLENASHAQIVRDVGVCRRIPSVEHRAGLCQDLASFAAGDREIREAALWAVSDDHPWVRREGLKLFSRDKRIVTAALSAGSDTTLFPGYLDLVMEGHRNGGDTTECVRDMTQMERQAILWAISVESGPG